MYFRSKIDLWIVVFAAACLLLPIGIVAFASTARSASTLLIVGLVDAPVIAFIAWIYASTGYTVNEKTLVARSGPFRWSVDLGSVTRVRPTRNPLSAPALSLDRIEIGYGAHGWMLVSPDDRSGFVRAIAARAPQASIQGFDASLNR